MRKDHERGSIEAALAGHVALADGWKLQVDGRQDKRWLFDLNRDPTEQDNLIDR